ncbi:MAG: LysE family translocator [Rhizobiaceae bacterium]|nr:LysE family translocator [Rhizobiaceae bacterium]
MELETLGLFMLTEALLSLTPGPAVLLVLGLSVRHGFKIGFAATLGILAVNAVYFALAALGIGAMILASAALFTLIKWVGAAYLVYLGVMMALPLLRRLSGKADGDSAVIDVTKASKAVGTSKRDFRKAFIRGFVLQASNPKNIAFFVAILPQFITPENNVALQLVILGVVSVAIEIPILLAYGFASSKSAALMKAQVVDWIEGIGGGILIGLGAALAMVRRP